MRTCGRILIFLLLILFTGSRPFDALAACSYSVTSRTTVTFNYYGGAASLRIAADDPACPAPNVRPNADWLSYSGPAFKNGKGTVRIKASSYQTGYKDRSGTVNIENAVLLVNQKAKPCTFGAFVPPQTSFDSNAHESSVFTVTARPSDCPWTASVDPAAASWITLTGLGEDTVTYDVSAALGKSRAGRINVNFTQVGRTGVRKFFTVRQSNKPPVSGNEIGFTSTGQLFEPVIVISGTATVLWAFDDGTTSASTTPSKNYGTPGEHLNRLKVTPWSAIRRINLGYDGSDGGSDSIEYVTGQNVSRVHNLSLAAPYLAQFCASYNPIASLNFTGFTNLDTIELYGASSLTSLTLTNTASLNRLCLEGSSSLSILDISGCTNLGDLRGSGLALSSGEGLIFAADTTYPNLWHFCVHDYPSYNRPVIPLRYFPSLREFWSWNDNQAGALDTRSNTNLTSVYLSYNQYTSADFTGSFPPGHWGAVFIDSNALTTLLVGNNPGLYSLNAQYNQLNQAAVDAVLAALDANGNTDGAADLSGNTAPSASGSASAASLRSKGWTVTVDGP